MIWPTRGVHSKTREIRWIVTKYRRKVGYPEIKFKVRQKGTAESGAVTKSDPERPQKMMEAYQMMRKRGIG
jgi:hypothetical protein